MDLIRYNNKECLVESYNQLVPQIHNYDAKNNQVCNKLNILVNMVS